MYGDIEIVIKRSHSIENLSPVCSYISKNFKQKEDRNRYLDVVSKKLIDLIDHNDDKKFIDNKKIHLFIHKIFRYIQNSF